MDIAQYRLEKAARVARGEPKVVATEVPSVDNFVAKVEELAEAREEAVAEVKFEDTVPRR